VDLMPLTMLLREFAVRRIVFFDDIVCLNYCSDSFTLQWVYFLALIHGERK
jgi:hypothetical protein